MRFDNISYKMACSSPCFTFLIFISATRGQGRASAQPPPPPTDLWFFAMAFDYSLRRFDPILSTWKFFKRRPCWYHLSLRDNSIFKLSPHITVFKMVLYCCMREDKQIKLTLYILKFCLYIKKQNRPNWFLIIFCLFS